MQSSWGPSANADHCNYVFVACHFRTHDKFLDDISTVWKDVGNMQGLSISVKLYLTPGTKTKEMSHATSTFH